MYSLCALRFNYKTRTDDRERKQWQAFIKKDDKEYIYVLTPESPRPENDREIFLCREVETLFASEDGNRSIIAVDLLSKIAEQGEEVTRRYRRYGKNKYKSEKVEKACTIVYVPDRSGLVPKNVDTNWRGQVTKVFAMAGRVVLLGVKIEEEVLSDRCKRRRERKQKAA